MSSSGNICMAGLISSDHIVPGASNSTEVSALLISLNLQQYIGVFVANDINTISTLKEMQDAHFRMLGVSLGHQLNILKCIRSGSESCSQCPLGLVGSSPNFNVVASVPSIVNQGREVNNSVLHSTAVPVLNKFSAPFNSVPASLLSTNESQEEIPFERATIAQRHHSVAACSSSDGHRSDAIAVVNRQANVEKAEKSDKAARPRLQDNERSGQKQPAPQHKTSAFRSHWDDSSSSEEQDAAPLPKKSRTVLAQVAQAAVKVSVNAHLSAFKAAFVHALQLIALELGSLHSVGNCEKVITRVVLHVDKEFGIQLTDVSTVYDYCVSAICNLHWNIYRSIVSNGDAALRGLDDLPDDVTGLTALQCRTVVKQTFTNSFTPFMNATSLPTKVCAVEIGMGAKQMTHAFVHAAMPRLVSLARKSAHAALTDADLNSKAQKAARAVHSTEPLLECFTAESIRQLLQRTVTLSFQPWRTLTK